MTLLDPTTDAEILSTFDVMHQLRPKLTRDTYVATIRRLMANERYRLVALLDDGRVCAVAGIRDMEMLYCGRITYVDDLVTDEASRSRGCGQALLDALKARAVAAGHEAIHLDSALWRVDAHRFYEREAMPKTAFHFAMTF